MRQPFTLNSSYRRQQQGFALFIVLMMMMVIALLIVAATQSYNTEQRISSNDSDRKLATTLAEAALKQGEEYILDSNRKEIFKEDCSDGMCTAVDANASGNSGVTLEGTPTVNAWIRQNNQNKFYIDINGKELNIKKELASNNPRYIIEYLNTADNGAVIYRVTSKAWGKNKNTVVMLQSYVSKE